MGMGAEGKTTPAQVDLCEEELERRQRGMLLEWTLTSVYFPQVEVERDGGTV